MDEEDRRGCSGCPNHIIIPSQMVEYCELKDNKCTYGE